MGATATLSNFWFDTPPRLGSPEAFIAARRVFDESGYNYANLCARLEVNWLYEYRMPPATEILSRPIEDGLGVLDRLFCQGLRLDRNVVSRYLSNEGRSALYAIGLLRPDPTAPEMDFAPAAVLPFRDCLFASDRFNTPAGEPADVPADAVYAALFDNTVNFVNRVPDTVCEALLDLGAGAGAAALCKAQSARHVWATDIAGRSAYFTEFNRRLNGRENITALAGDLYEPVRGLTFDRIVTQPPYVAVESDKIVYRDGGKDGEQIFRRIVEGLPEFLRPGGSCYALLMATDREGETFERRIQRWLGDHAAEFDILLGCDVAQEPLEFLLTARNIPPAEREHRRVLYQQTKTKAVLYCSVLIRRKRLPAPVVATRTFVSKSLRGEDLDFYLAWNVAAAGPDGFELLWNSRPRLGRHCELVVTHRVREGRLAAEEFELRTSGPFISHGKTPAWAPGIIAECDGTLTWGKRFEKLQAEGRIPSAVGREDFARMLIILVSTGALEVEKESLGFHGT